MTPARKAPISGGLSSRCRRVAESETLRISQHASRLRREGRDIVSLLEGEPDLPLPRPIAEATRRAIREGKTRYSDPAGLFELRARLAEKLKRRNGVDVEPEQVLVTNGAKQAIYETLQALCGPGDEVLIPAPCWVTFPQAARLAGARAKLVLMPEPSLDVARLETAVTDRTRAVVLNSPHNPTGAVYTEASLRALLRLSRERGFAVVSDEAYEDLVYGESRHVSPASLDADAARRVVTIGTFSKTFSMTGFRVGYLAAGRELVGAAARIHGHVTGNVCTFAQWGALAALGLGRGVIEKRRRILERRRDLAFRLCARLFSCSEPQGALFLFADARAYLGRRHPDDAALARFLLQRCGVAVVPGSACGRPGFLRLSFGGPETAIREGFSRIEEALCRRG